MNHFKQLDENVFLVDGNTAIDEAFEFFNLEGEEDNFEANTVSGWVIEKLGEIPRSGVKFSYLNLDVEVTKSTVKKILQVKITVCERNADDEEE